MPVATTVKVAVCPTAMVWLAGCLVITGGVGAVVVTVKVAGLLVTVPRELETVTVKSEPLSPVTVAGVV